jgi:hypothetical protein
VAGSREEQLATEAADASVPRRVELLSSIGILRPAFLAFVILPYLPSADESRKVVIRLKPAELKGAYGRITGCA